MFTSLYIYLERSKDNINLNRKGEWNGSTIPRMVVEVRDEVRQVDHDGRSMQNNKKRDLKLV